MREGEQMQSPEKLPGAAHCLPVSDTSTGSGQFSHRTQDVFSLSVQEDSPHAAAVKLSPADARKTG